MANTNVKTLHFRRNVNEPLRATFEYISTICVPTSGHTV